MTNDRMKKQNTSKKGTYSQNGFISHTHKEYIVENDSSCAALVIWGSLFAILFGTAFALFIFLG